MGHPSGGRFVGGQVGYNGGMDAQHDKLRARWLEIRAEIRRLREMPASADRDKEEEKLFGEKDGIEALLRIASTAERDALRRPPQKDAVQKQE